ncbi:MAG: hypothetical protein O9296_04550 [Novosphingobium sp.]|nr:hypothetical protein [Novosphingobium sp.]
MNISYAELEGFLAAIHRVAPEKRIALKGRLKHFQRLGWPSGTNQGKGARVQYGIGQTLMLAMGFELLQLGLTPERVVEQFKFSGRYLAKGFSEALAHYGPEAEPIYYAFSPESLASLRGDDVEVGFQSIMVSRDKVAELMQIPGAWLTRRFAFIDMAELLRLYADHFIDKGLGDPQNLREAIDNWVRISDAAADRWLNHVLEGMPYGDS